MVLSKTLLQKALDVIGESSSGAIVLPPKPTTDSVAAATALYLGLSKLGKNVAIACGSKVPAELTGADKIQREIAASGDHLVVSFPYVEGSIDKVDYYIQAERFHIVVIPGKNHPKIDSSDVTFSYSGGKIDFIITIDVPTLKDLGSLYSSHPKSFEGQKIINIDRHLTNSFFGTVNIVTRGVSSTSEIVLQLLQELQVEIDKDLATNLYKGVVDATKNFTTPTVSASTFEVTAALLRLGAAKSGKGLQGGNSIRFERQTVRPLESLEKEDDADEGNEAEDWLKPKIFRPNEIS